MKISSEIFASVLCVSMLFLSGCGTTQTDEVKSYDLNSFDVIDFSATEPERVSPQDMIIGNAYDMCMVSDSILAFQSIRSKMQLWLLNVNSGEFAQCLYYGNGPKECLGITNIWKNNGSLFVAGFQDHKILKIDINPDSLTTDIEYITELSEYLLKVIQLSDSTLLYAPISSPDVRYLIARKDGIVTDTVGEFYLRDRVDDGIMLQNSMFQMQIALSPDKLHMVSSNLSWPMIEIYTVPFDRTIILNGPVNTYSKIKEKVYDTGVITHTQVPGLNMFRGLATCNDGFALGLIGIELKTDEDYGKDPESILLFDWDGNPTKKIDFGREIVDFTIDFKSMTIYALVNDPEPMVVKYTLPVSYGELWEN
ncbi:MAG: TolB-like 6-bladed beta-propeller domain-containing protein [Rikenellaceae bacterium]|nr:TolB-like 6-bladed beta-propeller domain-containing protein [Rikenellaceae bacterium]